jgi:hypothetical protein
VSPVSEIRTFILIAIGVVIAAAGGIYLVISSSQADLSDLTAVEQPPGSTPILSWPSLLRQHSLAFGAGDAVHTGMELCALGYAMDADQPLRNGEQVNTFVLLPDAGNLVHPAHRFGDQMITVRLRQAETFHFRVAELVWVHGTFRVLPGDPIGPSPLYVLEQARVDPASKTTIARFFR